MLIRKIIFTALLVVAAGAVACGKPTQTATTVGPAGPTIVDSNGNSYNFTLKIYPNVIAAGNSITATVYVSCASGCAGSANGTILASAPLVYFSGAVAGTGTAFGVDGIVSTSFAPSGAAGTTGYVTATLLDQSLTAPFQIRP